MILTSKLRGKTSSPVFRPLARYYRACTYVPPWSVTPLVSPYLNVYAKIIPMKLYQHINSSKPQNMFELVLAGSTIFFLLSYAYNNTVFDLNLLRGVSFRPVEFYTYSFMCFMTVSGSISTHSSLMIRSKRLFLLICGLVLLIVPLAKCIYLSFWIPSTLQGVYLPEKINKLELMLQDETIDNEKKYFISSFIAKEKFMVNGELTEIIDKNGNKTMFIPSAMLQDSYNSKKQTFALLPTIKEKGIILFAILFFSTVGGLLLRNKHNKII